MDHNLVQASGEKRMKCEYQQDHHYWLLILFNISKDSLSLSKVSVNRQVPGSCLGVTFSLTRDSPDSKALMDAWVL